MREIQVLTRLIFILSALIELYWLINTILESQYYYEIVLVPFSAFISIFFVNSAINNIVAILIPRGWLHGNSVYYTDTYIADNTYQFPSLTIQIPVYKESFINVIKPTLDQAREACIQYEKHTGALANIYINDDGFVLVDEEERQTRLEYYDAHKDYLAFIARPPSGRRGKFKKAGNLNFALSSDACVVGDIILLIDCDTRIPIINMYKAVKEFSNPRVGFVQIKTRAMLSRAPDFWEKLVAHFTDNIYEVSFVVTCAYGDPSPLVGHNVMIRKEAMYECMRYKLVQNFQVCEISGSDLVYSTQVNKEICQLFSEEHVSEDFELSMRLQDAKYIGRYLSYIDGFEEGVSLNVVDEIVRLQKYAYGVNEILVNPLRLWCKKGIFCSVFKQYLLSPNITIASKYNVIGYMGTYYALASAPIMVTVHYFAFHYCIYWRSMYVTAENILYGCIAVFTILTPIAIIILKKKLSIRISILREILYSFIFGIFFSGIGFHLMMAILSHLLGFNMAWSSTNKEGGTLRDYLKALRQLWLSYLFAFTQIAIILVGWFVLDIRAWPAIVPIGISASAHIIVPLISLA
jgi:cellulose synthase/poly-beta-1,6-N-acetylglucosamine synthase-like glycosyltransferase